MNKSLTKSSSKNIIWSIGDKKMENNHLEMVMLQDRRIWIKVGSSVFVVIEAVQEGSRVRVNGRMSHLNGKCVEIPRKYEDLIR